MSNSGGQRWFLLNEDQLDLLIRRISPQIHDDINRQEDLIRELVNLERTKLGLDKPTGSIELWANKDKKYAREPDFIGSSRIAGRYYRAAAWLCPPDRIRIELGPRKHGLERSP